MHKVCHVTSVHESDDLRIFDKECISLAKNKDMKVYLVARGESRIEQGVSVIGAGEAPESRIKRALSFSKKVIDKAIDIDAEVYHLHDPELLMHVARLKKIGKKVIFDSHENTYEQIKIKTYIPGIVRGFVANKYLKKETKACLSADAVIIPSPVTEDHFFKGRCRRCVSVNNTPRLEEFYYKFADCDPSENDAVSYIGTLNEERGTENLIKGCFLAGKRLILAGTVASDDFFNRIKGMKEYECVDYRGWCDRSQISEILAETRIGANTLMNIGQYKNSENLSTKVYEYMAAGIPVVMNDFEFAHNLNDEEQFCLLIDPESPEEIAEAIVRLEDNNLYRRLSVNSRKLIKERFNWEEEERRLFDLYYDLLEEKYRFD